MLSHCAVTGLSGALHLKQEARASFAAMSREHVTEDDIKTFMHVQEIAMQVGKLVVGDRTCTVEYFQVNQNNDWFQACLWFCRV